MDAERPLEQQLLDALLTAFSEDGSIRDRKALFDTIRGREQNLLKRALMEAEQKLQDEAGAETAILRILETPERLSGRALSALFAESYLLAIDRPGDAGLLAAVDAAFASAWRQYRDRLLGPFNGAEAIRRASGSEFAKALLALAEAEAPLVAAPTDETSSQRLVRLAKGADYYARRLLGSIDDAPPANGLAVLAGSVVRPLFPAALPNGTNPVTPQDLRPYFEAAYVSALSSIGAVNDPTARFIPDNAPAPLPLQIAANMDGATIDDFAASFNGIAVAIRRRDTGDDADRWAHASLADLVWPSERLMPAVDKDPADPQVRAAIHPMLPSVSDGRGPMFIEYEGLPLAAETFSETSADAVPNADPSLIPFYDHKAPDLTASDFAKIPKLAYGRRFETFSFATSNAGTLPLLLQGDLPWMPKATFHAPEKTDPAGPDLVVSTEYQRRTAIGQIAANEVSKGMTLPRIGAPVDGVVPLAQDYPRTVLSAYAGSPGIRDIFRDRSGDGLLSIVAAPAGPIEWRIPDAVFSGQPEILSVRLFNGAPTGPDDRGLVEVTVSVGALAQTPADIRIGIRLLETGAGKTERRIYLRYGDAAADEATIPETGEIEGWLRLTLESGSSAALSFAATDELKPYEPAAPLLILAPDNAAWSGRLHEPVTLDVDAPRVGYLDFQRWFANSDSLADAFDTEKHPANLGAAERLETALLTAYVLRDTDEDLARHLDRLPDPAVCAIRIELAVEDQLVDLTTPASLVRTISLAGKLLDIAKALDLPAGARWTPARLKTQLFLPMEQAFRFQLSLQPGDFALSPKGPVFASLPAGVVARLSLHTLVPARHFVGRQAPGGYRHPSVLHAGLKQHAARVIAPTDTVPETCFSYVSPAIRIETMIDGMNALAGDDKMQASKPAIRLAAEMIAVRPVERARQYELETRGAVPPGVDTIARTRQWRLLSEIDITSQRWRPSGRPIYNHIDPAAFFDPSALSDAPDGRAPHAALPLRREAENCALAGFEQEAFFDRANVDSRTVTQRLLPLPARTSLEQHIWEAPSATYFRHRFTLRSRYAGALKNPDDRAVSAWITDRLQRPSPADAWTVRVAMLADLGRVMLTRPQQRALIPLTMAPRGEGEDTRTPPVLSILQEPPFARGGLADRIAAEIKTGFGYGFEGPQPGNPSPSLEVLDARKEIGPDPRLSYKALDESVALGIGLNVEGPIGMTFDEPNAPAPAFPNSMLSLAPVHASGLSLAMEEHFLGVSMRRYIDPNWTMRAAIPALEALDGERCWWIDHEVLEAGPLLQYRTNGFSEALLTLAKDGDGFTVTVNKAAIDGGVAGAVKKDVALCRWSRETGSNLAILHQPVLPGRFTASIFLLPQAASVGVSKGRSNAPLLLCSFEWSPRAPVVEAGSKDPDGAQQALTLQSSGNKARPAMVSAPTFLAWTRTARNFDSIHLPLFEDGETSSLQVRTGELLATFDEETGALAFGRNGFAGKIWPCASTFRSPYPLHVQRHLAVIATRFLNEPGRPVEQYGGSTMLSGNISGPLHRSAGSLDRVRIIEFETPAAILCGSAVPVPQTYRTAYFDLVSTGFKTAGGKASARLFFRFAGPGAHLRRFTMLTVKLSHATGDQKPHEVSIALNNAPNGPFAVAVEMSVTRTAEDAKLKYIARVLYSDGTFGSAPVSYEAPDTLGLRAIDNANPGLFVTIVALGADGAGEFWADVSLLHAPRAEFDRGFDFDWLFSPTGSDGPAIDVTPQGLAGMVEAQARIVSVSPPVPITAMPGGS